MSSTLGASLLRTVLSDGTLKILGSGLDKGPIIVVDMMRRADLMGGNSQRYLELFVDAAIIYAVLIFIVTTAGRWIEKRYTVGERQTERVLLSEE